MFLPKKNIFQTCTQCFFIFFQLFIQLFSAKLAQYLLIKKVLCRNLFGITEVLIQSKIMAHKVFEPLNAVIAKFCNCLLWTRRNVISAQWKKWNQMLSFSFQVIFNFVCSKMQWRSKSEFGRLVNFLRSSCQNLPRINRIVVVVNSIQATKWIEPERERKRTNLYYIFCCHHRGYTVES